MEGRCDNYAAEHRKRLLPIIQGELLLLEDVKETMSQGSTWHVLYSAHGGLNQTWLVVNSVGPRHLHRFKHNHMAEEHMYHVWAELRGATVPKGYVGLGSSCTYWQKTPCLIPLTHKQSASSKHPGTMSHTGALDVRGLC
ncbi:hypothetical protein MTO96_016181, partial [Rhipicephalus appendiculatus]